MVPEAKKVPHTEILLGKLNVGSSQSTGIVTRVCRPSGINSIHHREPPHPSVQLNHLSEYRFTFMF